MDGRPVRIGYARWMVWLFSIATPAFVLLFIAATWVILARPGSVETKALAILLVWPIFLGLLIVPGCWYLSRILRGIPALQIDSRGILWGNDWERDAGIGWEQIARIRSRLLPNDVYMERLLLIDAIDPTTPPRASLVARMRMSFNREMYGTPFAVGLGTLQARPEEIVALIRHRFPGDISVAEIA